MLTRNIRIVGFNEDEWGGQVVINDSILPATGDVLKGEIIFDHVEVKNCGQRDTHNAAIRFDNALQGLDSHIQNSVIHGSLGWLMKINSSANIKVTNTAFIGGRGIGINLHNVNNVEIDGIFVADINSQDLATSPPTALVKEACVAMCSQFSDSSCINTYIRNSIAAGCSFGGFVAPGHECEEPNENFYNNIAHSIKGSGFYIFPDPLDNSQDDCFEASYLTAYKV